MLSTAGSCHIHVCRHPSKECIESGVASHDRDGIGNPVLFVSACIIWASYAQARLHGLSKWNVVVLLVPESVS